MAYKNVMFVHIPKAAGTSIEKSLGFIRARTPAKFAKWFNNEGHYSFGHIDVRKRLKNGVISKEFYDSAFKFCFCRNPYDRAISHFFYVKKRHPDQFSRKTTFLEFTRTLGNYGKMFRLQTYYTNGLDFDFIGKFENLKEDFNKIKKIIGVEAELMVTNTTKHQRYIKYYDEETANNILNFYKDDFDFFKYNYGIQDIK